jgi:hypothetical protein
LKFNGKVWRHVPSGAHPLHAGFILSAGGRWNRQDVYGCLYASLTQEGVLKELEKMLERSGVGGFPMRTRDLVSIQVDLHPVADLINRKTSPIPPDATFLTSNDPGDYEACRALADRLRFEGYVAILSPSAAMPGGVNLNIYIDGIAGNIILQDGEDRIPIDPHLIKLSP